MIWWWLKGQQRWQGRYLHRFEADRHCPLSQSHTWILVYVSDGGHKFCLMLMILHVQIREELGDLLDHVKQGGRGRSPTCLVTLLTLSGSLSMSRGVQYLSFVMTWHDKVFFSQYTWALYWKYRSKIEVKFAINLVLNYLLLIFPTWSEMLMAMVLLLSTKGAITDLSLSAAWFTCKRVVTSLVGSLAKDSEQKHKNTP